MRYISFQNMSDLDTRPFKVTQVKFYCRNGLSIYAFLLMFNSNIWPKSAPLQEVKLRNLSDLDFDLSRSLKIKCDGLIGLSIYGFLLINIVTTCLSLTV